MKLRLGVVLLSSEVKHASGIKEDQTLENSNAFFFLSFFFFKTYFLCSVIS